MKQTLEQKTLVLTEKQMYILLEALKHSKFTGTINAAEVSFDATETHYHLFVTLPEVQAMIGYIGSYVDDTAEESINIALALDAKLADLVTW